jgi:NAD dependent epimerase/dehydratase family enzyme
MAKILITGGTGLVGTKLTEILISEKHEVVILTRSPDKKNEFKWDISKKYIDLKAFENVDYIIHLAGAGIADERWTDERKKVIIDS